MGLYGFAQGAHNPLQGHTGTCKGPDRVQSFGVYSMDGVQHEVQSVHSKEAGRPVLVVVTHSVSRTQITCKES